MPAGPYRIPATLSGDGAVIYASGAVDIPAGSTIIALVTKAHCGRSPIGLVLLQQNLKNPVVALDDARARAHAVHASPDAPEVNILLNDSLVFNKVLFGVDSAY